MLLAYIINIICYYFVQILKLKYLSSFFRKKDNLINPLVIVFLSQLPVDVFKVVIGPSFLLDGGVTDIYYNLAIVYTTLGLLADYVLLRVVFMISNRYHILIPTFNFRVRLQRMKFAAILFYGMFLVSFVLLASSSFGVVNWIRDPRAGYQFHRMGAGQFWLFAISFLSVSFALMCLYIRRTFPLIILLFLIVSSAYLLGSKGIILDFFIFFLIILWVREFKYLRLFFFLGVPFALLLMLLNFFSSGGVNSDMTSVFTYFDYYVNAAMYYQAYYTGKIDLFYGKIFFTEFWNLVPRGLYPNKPYVYGITHVNEFFFPGAAEETNTPAFGGPVNYFADFGVLGVILCSLLNPFKFVYYFFFCQLLKNYTFENIKHSSWVLLLFIFFTAPFFLFSLAFPLNLIFFFMVASIILIMNVIRVKNENTL